MIEYGGYLAPVLSIQPVLVQIRRCKGVEIAHQNDIRVNGQDLLHGDAGQIGGHIVCTCQLQGLRDKHVVALQLQLGIAQIEHLGLVRGIHLLLEGLQIFIRLGIKCVELLGPLLLAQHLTNGGKAGLEILGGLVLHHNRRDAQRLELFRFLGLIVPDHHSLDASADHFLHVDGEVGADAGGVQLRITAVQLGEKTVGIGGHGAGVDGDHVLRGAVDGIDHGGPGQRGNRDAAELRRNLHHVARRIRHGAGFRHSLLRLLCGGFRYNRRGLRGDPPSTGSQQGGQKRAGHGGRPEAV